MTSSFEIIPEAKVSEKTNFIATHNGIFHADEVMASAIYIEAINGEEDPMKEKVQIVRTRNPKVLERAVCVYDVGGEYNPEGLLFDHHQDNAPERQNGEPYSSAGLMWKHYGQAIVRGMLPEGLDEDETLIKEICSRIDQEVMLPIDLLDNGAASREGLHFSGVISGMNPVWIEEVHPDKQFGAAIELCLEVLRRAIVSEVAIVIAEDTVLNAQIYADSLILPKFMPWQTAVFKHEKFKKLLYVAFPDNTGEYRLQCVPTEKDGFDQRRPLPESWAGLRGEELDQAVGTSGCVFCHKGRFIAGAKTKQAIMEMIAKAQENE